MATKVKEDELFDTATAGVLDEPLVHTMVRAIASTAVPVGETQMIWEVDKEISDWVARGYHLVNTHYLGREPEGWNVMYILSK